MTNQNFSEHPPEFSRIVNIVDLSTEDKPLKITATPKECEAIARRLHIKHLEKFTISAHIKKNLQKNIFTIDAVLQADITYVCSLTLEPFKDIVSEEIIFKVTYPVAQESSSFSFLGEEIDIDPEENDIEEILDPSGNIDLGEIMTQYLSLLLDPYPRSKDSNEEPFEYKDNSSTETSRPNPFDKLSLLKPKA